MLWTENSSGQEAFDAVMAHMSRGPMKNVDYKQCVGFQLWRRFLNRLPNSTLGECLTEFEHMQRKQSNAAWPLILMEVLGKEGDIAVRTRIMKAAEGDAALNVLSGSVKLSKEERDLLRERRHKGKVRLGKGAPPDAHKFYRRRKDG